YLNKHQSLLVSRAKDFIEALVSNDYKRTVKHYDSTMLKAAPPDKMKEVWEMILAQTGPFKSQKDFRLENAGIYEIVYITCEFEKAALDIKVVFDNEGKIAGQFFVPIQQQQNYQPPSYINKKSFKETDIQLGNGEWILPGTLTIPVGEGPFPGLVLVHGSGPNDRDETLGPNKPFKDLAWGLASRGIAVLRYDKRTKIYGKKIIKENLRLTVKEETIDDALLGIELLRDHEKINPEKTFILGHSLGGTLIPRIGIRDKNIAGCIILAGLTRPIEDTFLEQTNYIFSFDGKISQTEKKKLQELKNTIQAIKNLNEKELNSNKNYLGAAAVYWLDIRNYYPPETAKKMDQPLLILQGGRDYQVTEEDFNAWKDKLSCKDNVQFKFYPDLNHLFIEGTGKIAPEEYQKAGHVDIRVIEEIAGWIKQIYFEL
ncbi:MAG: DUF3887 domain-containing protein, partial [Candidatus Aminicenantes bacterium]|nr:DUF3887 domain-containing protein [Candidatus Aminicenantes bacterium]